MIRIIGILFLNTISTLTLTISAVAQVNAAPIEITVGQATTCTVKSDHTLKCWGTNFLPNKFENRDIQSVSMGYGYLCAAANGKVHCWGTGAMGALTPPSGLNDATRIATKGFYSCALKKDRRIVCWGGSLTGQPVQPPADIVDVNEFDVGDRMACAIVHGKVRCWGGIKEPANLGPALHVATGINHACAILAERTVRCWSDGYGDRRGETKPPADLRDVEQLALGNEYSCALVKGIVRCWGDKDGPIHPPKLSPVTRLSAGMRSVCAWSDLEGLNCWGDSGGIITPNRFTGEASLHSGLSGRCFKFGTDATCVNKHLNADYQMPDELHGIQDIKMGNYHACVLAVGGDLQCWAYADDKEIATMLTGVRQMATVSEVFGAVACALFKDQTVNCWGHQSSPTVTEMPKDLSGVEEIAVGVKVGCALTTKELRCWGNKPFSVKMDLDPVKHIAIYGSDVCGLRSSGKVDCWGDGRIAANLPKTAGTVTQLGQSGGLYGQMACVVTSDQRAVCWDAWDYVFSDVNVQSVFSEDRNVYVTTDRGIYEYSLDYSTGVNNPIGIWEKTP